MSQEVLDEQFILVPALAIVVVAMLAPVGCGLKATVLPFVQHRYASVLIPALAMGGSWFQFEASLVNPEPFSESLLGLGEAEVVTEVAAITDEGRIVALVRYPSESVAQASLVVPKAIRSNLVRSAAADSRYNCHGWVFTAGKFLVRGADVDQILADNHYQPVSAPRANDVVVYRTPQGHVCHTGLVRSVDDHEVVVESKWGLGPRFVHRVQDQTYSNQFDYYRANRESHVLRFDAVRHETQTAVHNRVDELVAEKPRHSSG